MRITTTQHRGRSVAGYWMFLGAATSLTVGAAVGISADRVLALGFIGTGALIGAAYLASTRFELFTMIMIAARTAVDITHNASDIGLLRLSVFVTGTYTVIASFWLLSRRAHGRLRISTVTLWVGVFAGASILSAAFSSDPGQAILGASRWVFLLVFVLSLENVVTDQKSARRLLWAVAASTVVPLVLGLTQFVSAGTTVADGFPRIEGSFSHPNTYGFYLTIAGLILVSVLTRLAPVSRLLAGGLLVAIIVSLLATYSRTSYVAFVVGLVFLAIVGRRKGLLAVTGLVIAASLLFPGVLERVTDVGEMATVRGTAGDSLAWRLDYWHDVIAVGEGRRITGVGLGVAGDLTTQEREPHNDFVRAYVEVGLIGLAAYVGLIIALGRRVARSLQVTKSAREHDGFSRALAEGFAAVFAAYLVASVTSNLMTQLILLWYVLALGIAATLPHERGRRIVGITDHQSINHPSHA